MTEKFNNHVPSLAIWFIITELGIWIMGVMFSNFINPSLEETSGGGNCMFVIPSKLCRLAICAPIANKH